MVIAPDFASCKTHEDLTTMVSPTARCGGQNSHLLAHVLLGDEIEVWWPQDSKFYPGIVAKKRPEGKYLITYHDGDTEDLDLSKERWRFMGDAFMRVSIALNQSGGGGERSTQPSPGPNDTPLSLTCSTSSADDDVPVSRVAARRRRAVSAGAGLQPAKKLIGKRPRRGSVGRSRLTAKHLNLESGLESSFHTKKDSELMLHMGPTSSKRRASAPDSLRTENTSGKLENTDLNAERTIPETRDEHAQESERKESENLNRATGIDEGVRSKAVKKQGMAGRETGKLVQKRSLSEQDADAASGKATGVSQPSQTTAPVHARKVQLKNKTRGTAKEGNLQQPRKSIEKSTSGPTTQTSKKSLPQQDAVVVSKVATNNVAELFARTPLAKTKDGTVKATSPMVRATSAGKSGALELPAVARKVHAEQTVIAPQNSTSKRTEVTGKDPDGPDVWEDAQITELIVKGVAQYYGDELVTPGKAERLPAELPPSAPKILRNEESIKAAKTSTVLRTTAKALPTPSNVHFTGKEKSRKDEVAAKVPTTLSSQEPNHDGSGPERGVTTEDQNPRRLQLVHRATRSDVPVNKRNIEGPDAPKRVDDGRSAPSGSATPPRSILQPQYAVGFSAPATNIDGKSSVFPVATSSAAVIESRAQSGRVSAPVRSSRVPESSKDASIDKTRRTVTVKDEPGNEGQDASREEIAVPLRLTSAERMAVMHAKLRNEKPKSALTEAGRQKRRPASGQAEGQNKSAVITRKPTSPSAIVSAQKCGDSRSLSQQSSLKRSAALSNASGTIGVDRPLVPGTIADCSEPPKTGACVSRMQSALNSQPAETAIQKYPGAAKAAAVRDCTMKEVGSVTGEKVTFPSSPPRNMKAPLAIAKKSKPTGRETAPVDLVVGNNSVHNPEHTTWSAELGKVPAYPSVLTLGPRPEAQKESQASKKDSDGARGAIRNLQKDLVEGSMPVSSSAGGVTDSAAMFGLVNRSGKSPLPTNQTRNVRQSQSESRALSSSEAEKKKKTLPTQEKLGPARTIAAIERRENNAPTVGTKKQVVAPGLPERKRRRVASQNTLTPGASEAELHKSSPTALLAAVGAPKSLIQQRREMLVTGDQSDLNFSAADHSRPEAKHRVTTGQELEGQQTSQRLEGTNVTAKPVELTSPTTPAGPHTSASHVLMGAEGDFDTMDLEFSAPLPDNVASDVIVGSEEDQPSGKLFVSSKDSQTPGNPVPQYMPNAHLQDKVVCPPNESSPMVIDNTIRKLNQTGFAVESVNSRQGSFRVPQTLPVPTAFQGLGNGKQVFQKVASTSDGPLERPLSSPLAQKSSRNARIFAGGATDFRNSRNKHWEASSAAHDDTSECVPVQSTSRFEKARTSLHHQQGSGVPASNPHNLKLILSRPARCDKDCQVHGKIGSVPNNSSNSGALVNQNPENQTVGTNTRGTHLHSGASSSLNRPHVARNHVPTAVGASAGTIASSEMRRKAQPSAGRRLESQKVSQDKEKKSLSLPLDVLVKSMAESHARSLQTGLTPLSNRLDSRLTSVELKVQKCAPEFSKISHQLEDLRKAQQNLSSTNETEIKALNETVASLSNAALSQTSRVIQKMEMEIRQEYSKLLEEKMQTFQSILTANMQASMKKVIEESNKVLLAEINAQLRLPERSIPRSAGPVEINSAERGGMISEVGEHVQPDLLHSGVAEPECSLTQGRGTFHSQTNIASQAPVATVVVGGKVVAKRGLELIGMAVMEWMLRGSCRELAPITERDFPVSVLWVKDTCRKCLTDISKNLETYTSYQECVDELRKKIGSVDTLLDWLVKEASPENIAKARRNYVNWNPQLHDFEWESEKRVILKLAQEVIKVQVDLSAARMNETDPLASAQKCIQIARTNLGASGW